jgi:predicted transposase YbfD/YdcC
MTLPLCKNKKTTFYSDLQTTLEIDLRDNRGKRHDLSFVLLGFIIALFSNRDGNLSSLHRHMLNHQNELCKLLGVEYTGVVSRAQLPKILSKINEPLLNKLVLKYFGIHLTAKEQSWFAVDGKELRGSCLKGDTRGESVVLAVEHSTRITMGQTFYNGSKESEKPAVQALLAENGLLNQKITVDALHFNPKTLQPINLNQGFYVVGLKKNQLELFNKMEKTGDTARIKYSKSGFDDKHGRDESRLYQMFDVKDETYAPRWDKSGIKTLIKVTRKFKNKKTKKESLEISYYLSNKGAKNLTEANELFNAIRNHWSVETCNHVRDVTLKEDKLRTKKTNVQEQ